MSAVSQELKVVKRNGEVVEIEFDKIMRRVKKVGVKMGIAVDNVNYSFITIKVIDQLYDKIQTTKIDELLAEQCATLATKHPDYALLANGLILTNHQKNTRASFTEVVCDLYDYYDGGKHKPLVAEFVRDFAVAHKDWVDGVIDHERDFLIDYFGFKTLERNYLFRKDGVVMERIQHMWMRVAVGIHCEPVGEHLTGPVGGCIADMLVEGMKDRIKETYDLMSQKYFIHATPTLYNAGTPRPQLSSCFLVGMESDSIDGIFNTVKECALISKYSGGVGLHIHNIRGKGSYISGTNGTSNGIVPMMRVLNTTARYVDQAGRRNGSFAIYLEPHHPDIEDFLDMKRSHGEEETRARDLFYALWVSDLFMERVKANGDWSLFCPNECPGLDAVWGDAYRELYEKYEREGRAKKTMRAQALWFHILDAQMETGTPYILYKDAANRKSNQQNLGTIRSSNLCCEIIEYSDAEETAVCNLASIALPTFIKRVGVKDGKAYSVTAANGSNGSNGSDEGVLVYDFKKLHEVAKTVTWNLNRVIDINFYPTEKSKRSNMRHRPIGIGVQGLADAFIMMGYAFNSKEARELNVAIFETIYHGALEASCRAAKMQGKYETYEGSPVSRGVLQCDMWGVTPSDRFDWGALRADIARYGLRNSLLVAPMPTASTSQILGFNECFEPITNNIYTRRTLAGEFMVVNKYLLGDLIKAGVWSDKTKNSIIAKNGSVQHLDVPAEIKEKYRTVWELPMRDVIDMSADRGAFICQSQSLNLWLDDPTYGKLTSMHMYSWGRGLKTGIYYLRRKPKHQAQQFTIEPEAAVGVVDGDDDGGCEFCSA